MKASHLLANMWCAFPNAAGIDGTLYEAWWCEPQDGVQKWNLKSFSYLKVLKTWRYSKISELPLQKIP